eukprot:RCo011412
MSLEALVQSYCSSSITEAQRQDTLSTICKELQSTSSPYLTLVALMSGVLGGEDTDKRRRGLELVCGVLRQCSVLPRPPNAAELHTFQEFVTARLHDTPCIQVAAEGLAMLLHDWNYPPEDAKHVAEELISVVLPSSERVEGWSGSLTQTKREMLRVVQQLLSKYRDVVQEISTKFVPGFVNIIDGERDSKSLILAFTLHAQIMKTLDQTTLGFFHSEMFDVVACYFPVTYRPSPTEASGITSEELKEKLKECMTAPEFAAYCIPFLTSKLPSPTQQTKLDCLDVLKECASRYGPLRLAPYCTELWKVLRLEIISESLEEDKTVLAALFACLSSILAVVGTCPDPQKLTDCLSGFVTAVMNLVISPIPSQSAAYATMVHHATLSSGAICAALVKAMVPKLRTMYFAGKTTAPQTVGATALSAVTSFDSVDLVKQREYIVFLMSAVMRSIGILIQRGETPKCSVGPLVEVVLDVLTLAPSKPGVPTLRA